MKSKKYTLQRAFTIVELLVVIVVIAILAAISFVAYSGINSRATASTLQTDLAQASKQLKLYQVEHSAFPISFNSSNCPLDSAGAVDTKYCLKPSSNTTLAYQASDATNPQSFSLNAKATNKPNGDKYNITDATSPTQLATTCPTGFIVVPGSATYGTTDFCVMKYEAKDNGSGVAVSTAAGLPWVSISQNTALIKSQAACTGCHLITEAEWMTLAQNVLGVASNWDNGSGTHAVGTGYI